MSNVLMQNLRIAFIGAATGMVHFAVASLLLAVSDRVFWINTDAFLVAFGAGLAAHLRYVLPNSTIPTTRYVRWLAVTSVAGFILNQATLLMLLWNTAWSERMVVFVATALATALTVLAFVAWLIREND